MYRKLTAAIVATIMTTALFASFATASPAADTSVNVKERVWAQGNKDYVFEVTVTNNGDNPIENVQITRPNANWSGPWSVFTLPEDNMVELAGSSFNSTVLDYEGGLTDDATVKDNHVNSNYGSDGKLYVGNYYGENERAFIQFDFSALSSGVTSISGATLQLYDYNGANKEFEVGVYQVDNDDWSEDSITWDNAHWGDVESRLDNDLVGTSETYNTFDVTSFVSTEFSGDATVTFLVRSENENVGSSAGYDSKESDYDPDKIKLTIDHNPIASNPVTLKAGTNTSPASDMTVDATEGTELVREKDMSVTWASNPYDNDTHILYENANVSPATATTTAIADADNIVFSEDQELNIVDIDVYLDESPAVIGLTENSGTLINDTKVRVNGTTELSGTGSGWELSLAHDKALTLDDNLVTLNEDVEAKDGTILRKGENLELVSDNTVVARTSAKLETRSRAPNLDAFDNTKLTRRGETDIFFGTAEKSYLPEGWNTTESENSIMFTASGENRIAPGESEAFKFAMNTPYPDTEAGSLEEGGAETYTWPQVAVWDSTGDRAYTGTFETYVDTTAPTFYYVGVGQEEGSIAVKPGQTVEITPVTSYYEVVTGLEDENVVEIRDANSGAVMEKLGNFETSDNVEWTNSVTIDPSWASWENGVLDVAVVSGAMRDQAGHVNSEWSNLDEDGDLIYLDNTAPKKPQSVTYSGEPSLPNATTEDSWRVRGLLSDNENMYPVTEMTAHVSINGTETTQTIDPSAGEDFSTPVTLTEGTNTVTVWAEDQAGWMDENIENTVTLDTVTPDISLSSIGGLSESELADGVPTNDSTPTISLTISDEALGIENQAYVADNMAGYTVKLRKSDNTVMDTLTNSLTWSRNTLEFENTVPMELPGNEYNIFVIGGDNFHSENAFYSFEVDTKAPAEASDFTGFGSGVESKTNATPLLNKESISISGSTDPSTTVTVFIGGEEVASTTSDEEGDWTADVSLSEGMNEIMVQTTDEAGNSSDKVLYGYVDLTVDETAPTITLEDGIPKETSNDIVTVKGSVSDDVTEAQDIVLQVNNERKYPDGNGDFNVNVSLKEGTNTISVVATDEAGNTSPAKTRTVTKTVPEAANWAMYATFAAIIAIILAVIAIIRRGS